MHKGRVWQLIVGSKYGTEITQCQFAWYGTECTQMGTLTNRDHDRMGVEVLKTLDRNCYVGEMKNGKGILSKLIIAAYNSVVITEIFQWTSDDHPATFMKSNKKMYLVQYVQKF